MKRIQKTIFITLALFGFVALAPAAATVNAQVCTGKATDCIGNGVKKSGGDQNTTPLETNIKTVTNVLLFLLGAIAVIMIIIGGILYVTSNGDTSATKAAKDTILYAVIGLIVAILAYAIVNFVITSFTGN